MEQNKEDIFKRFLAKAEKRADKLEAAKEALPKKRVVTKGNRL